MVFNAERFERIISYMAASESSFFETAIYALGLSTVNPRFHRNTVLENFELTETQLDWLNHKNRTNVELVDFMNSPHDGYNIDGRDVHGFDREGYDIFGCDMQGLDRSGVYGY
jgi:hypothetical protein